MTFAVHECAYEEPIIGRGETVQDAYTNIMEIWGYIEPHTISFYVAKKIAVIINHTVTVEIKREPLVIPQPTRS